MKRLEKAFITKPYKEDMYISLFVVIYFLISCSGFTVKQVLNIPEALHPMVNLFFAFSLAFIGIIVVWSVLRRSFMFFLFIESFGIIIYIASYLQGGIDFSAMPVFFRTVGYMLVGVFAYSIKDKQIFYKLFLNISYIMFAIVLLNIFFPAKNYDMSFSYAILTPTLFHINEWLSSRKKRYFILFCAEITVIVLHGSRGTLLCVGVFFLSKFLVSHYSTIKKIIISVCGSVAGLLFFGLFLERILIFVSNFLSDAGYGSRTIGLLMDGMATNDSGRSEIYQYCFSRIQQKPFFGWGVWGVMPDFGYPHNIVIEFICSFGYITGIFLCCVVFILSCKTFLKKDKTALDVGLIFFSCSIPRLMISHSFLISPTFWVFVSLALSGGGNSLYTMIFYRLKSRPQKLETVHKHQ